jgi:thiol-disulfide isomerase/thioredoxin
VTGGVIAMACALALATAFGLYWKARDGRIVSQAGRGPAKPEMNGAIAPALATAGQTEWTRLSSSEDPETHGQSRDDLGKYGLSREDLGTPLGTRATLVQFSSAFCAPCRATRRILADVSCLVDGVTHVEIDAESRLDLVRRLDVKRTPTTFVLGPDGRVTHRASGQPRKADVIAALGAVQ